MARKNLLRDLMTGTETAAEDSAALEVDSRQPAPGRPRGPRGAIGAVGRSIADLKSRALVDLDPELIDAGGLPDRLEHDEADHARLMASLREHGQQVPVLVRPHPEAEGRYQIVYGRRRVRALRELGLPVKAMLRELDDEALVLAQGQENSARRDLSFIEKANFAQAMIAAGYGRETAGAALTVDKTVVSRMLSITGRIPPEVIAAVGAAPGIGRDRWLALAESYAGVGQDAREACDVISKAAGQGSDARFAALEDWLRGRKASRGGKEASDLKAEIVLGHDGARLAEVVRGRGGLSLKFESKGLDGFDAWLLTNLADLRRDWQEREGCVDSRQHSDPKSGSGQG